MTRFLYDTLTQRCRLFVFVWRTAATEGVDSSGRRVGGSGYVVWRTDSREWCAHNLKRYGISEKSTEQKPTQDDNKRQTSQLPNPDTTQWKAKSPLPMWQELQ
jgi:hypothetical protein